MKKILCLMLSLMMIVGLLAACGDEETETTTVNKETKEQTTTAGEEETTTMEETLDFPEENNDNTEINILVSTALSYEYQLENSADLVESSMFKRDCDVEEYLGVVFNYKPEAGGWSDRNTFNTHISTSVASDNPEFDLVGNSISCCMVYDARDGLFMDVNKVNSLSMTGSWWMKNMTESYGINGKLYGVIGDSSLGLYREMNVLYFNSDLVSDLGLTSPYKQVDDDNWTFETMRTMALQCADEGAESYDATTNKMGILARCTPSRFWLVAFDIDLTTRDEEDGSLTVSTTPSEKLQNAFTNLFNLYEDNDNCMCVDTTGEKSVEKIFAGGNTLFLLSTFNNLTYFRDMTDDYGVVPMCKYDSDQTEYYSPVGTAVQMMHIPTNTAADVELLGKVLEATAYFGQQDVVDNYYNVALKYTYSRESDMGRMLAIIRESATLTVDGVFQSAFSPAMWNVLETNEKNNHPTAEKVGSYHGENIVTWWASNISTWTTQASNLYEDLK